MTKPRDALRMPPSTKRRNLGSLTRHLCDPEQAGDQDILDYYIHSDVDESRYSRFGLAIEERSFITLQNPVVPNFARLGSNEAHVLNQIMFGANPITVIVGTIGAGKTTLCKFLQRILEGTKIPQSDHYPLQVYVDLNQHAPIALYRSTVDRDIVATFYDVLATHLRYGISSICDIETEIVKLWDDALASPPPRPLGPEFKRIVGELRAQQLDRWNEPQPGRSSASDVLLGRRQLHTSLGADKYRFCAYLCEVLSHLRHTVFGGTRWGIVLYIDNLDQISVHAQQVIRTTLLPLLRIADVRSVVMMRVSTWRMARNDAFTFPIDRIPHTGPEPRKAVLARLHHARLVEPGDHGVKLDDPAQWVQHLDQLISALKVNSEISECLSRLSGYSIRKALIISQHLLASFEFPPEEGRGWEHHLKRMMIAQGPPGGYRWSEDNVVDNLFEVHVSGAQVPLLKLRILWALRSASDAHPMYLNTLRDLFAAFGYETEELRFALNELMQHHKRIVWLDSLLHFDSSECFIAAGRARLYASTAAKGYQTLASDFDYLREVALDTDVPGFVLSDEPRAGSVPPARFFLEAILRFMEWLWHKDVVEMVRFLERHSVAAYSKYFASDRLLVSEFLLPCLDQCDRILERTRGHKVDELKQKSSNLRRLVALPLDRVAAIKVSRDLHGEEIISF
jgi:hypothetical protein